MADLGDTNPSFTYTGTKKPWADCVIELNEKINWFKNLIDNDSEKDLDGVIVEFENLIENALGNEHNKMIEVFKILIENPFEYGIHERVDAFRRLIDDPSENENIEKSVQERVNQEKAGQIKTNAEKAPKKATRSRRRARNAAQARQQRLEEQIRSTSEEQDEQQKASKSINLPEFSNGLKSLKSIETQTDISVPVFNYKAEYSAHQQKLLNILKINSGKQTISSERKCMFGERVAKEILVGPEVASTHGQDCPKRLYKKRHSCLDVVTEASSVVKSKSTSPNEELRGYFGTWSGEEEGLVGRREQALVADHIVIPVTPAHRPEISRRPSNEVEICLGRLVESILVADHTPTPTQNLELLDLFKTPSNNPGRCPEKLVECKLETIHTPIRVQTRELSTLLNWEKPEELTKQEGAVLAKETSISPPPASETFQELDNVQTKLDSVNLAHQEPEKIITLSDELREDSIYKGVNFIGLSKAWWGPNPKLLEESSQETLLMTIEDKPSTPDPTKVKKLFALIMTSIQHANILEFIISILITMVASVIGHRIDIMG